MYNNMQANILPLHTPSIPGVGTKGFKKNENMVMLQGMKGMTTTKQIFCPYTHWTPGMGSKD